MQTKFQLKYGMIVGSILLCFAIIASFGRFIFLFDIFKFLQLIVLFFFSYIQIEIFDLKEKNITNKIIFAIISYIPVFIAYVFIVYLNFWNPFEFANRLSQIGNLGLFLQAANQYAGSIVGIIIIITVSMFVERKYPVSKLFRGLQEYIQKLKFFIRNEKK